MRYVAGEVVRLAGDLVFVDVETFGVKPFVLGEGVVLNRVPKAGVKVGDIFRVGVISPVLMFLDGLWPY